MAGTESRKIPGLHYISQGSTPKEHLSNVERMLKAGAPLVQLRMKEVDERQLLFWAEQCKTLCDEYDCKLIINDSAVVASVVGAWGVHLGLNDQPIENVKKAFPGLIVGGTANSSRDVEHQIEQGADYIGLGPFRFTMTKERLSPVLGVQGTREILARPWSVPVIAVGGIQSADIEQIMACGASGVALSGALTASPEPEDLIRNILSNIELNYKAAHA